MTLKTFLLNAITPIDLYTVPLEVNEDYLPSVKNSSYRWTYIKEKDAVRYIEIDPQIDSDPIERIFSIMKDRLESFQNLESVEASERYQLDSLATMVTHYTKEYKAEHKGFFGAIYLLWQGFTQGGHVDELSSGIQESITQLLAKQKVGETPIKMRKARALEKQTELDKLNKGFNTLLKGVSSHSDSQNNRFNYCKEKKAIKYSDLTYEEERPGVDQYRACDLEKALQKIKKMLKPFKNLEEVDETQKMQLAYLKRVVTTSSDAYRKKNNGFFSSFSCKRIDRLTHKIFKQVDFLLNQVNAPLPPSRETKEKMRFQAACIRMEILSTEERFIADIAFAINAIHKQKTLDGYLEPFSVLKMQSEEILNKLQESFNTNYTDEEKNKSLCHLYCSDQFKGYAEAMAVCVSYYKQGLHSPTKADPFIPVVQRMVRHTLFMGDFWKNTPNDSENYLSAFSALQRTERYTRQINNA